MKRVSYWQKNIVELIRRTSTSLPADVEGALKRNLRKEKKGSHAAWFLDGLLENVQLARSESLPICQDTGTLNFYYSVPAGFDTNALVAETKRAVSEATRHGYLRQNTINAVTGLPVITNVSDGSPVFHFTQGARKTVDVRLVMKGGGCENVGQQYSLPNVALDAGRDLAGVRKCVLDAVWQAQGNGCAPGIVGVCIGGDRASGMACAKQQFLRKIGDRSPLKKLAQFERMILRESAKLGIGPMGGGGRSTLLDVKVGTLSRLPASFFVSVSFMCWAFRRRGALLGPEGGVQRWLY